MDERIYNAFDGIRAEESLKAKTLQGLRDRVYERPRRFSFARVAVLSATLVLLLAFSVSGLYFTPSAYIDLDINPSLSLSVNRFGRIIGADSLNDESGDLLAEVQLRNKPYSEGVEALINAALSAGYVEKSGLISITLQTNDSARETAILTELESTVAQSLQSHHASADSEVYPVSQELLETAHRHNVSPAKYVAISELQAVDESAAFEDSAHHSIPELRKRTQHHGGRNENEGDGALEETEAETEIDSSPADDSGSQGGKGHQKRKRKGHH